MAMRFMNGLSSIMNALGSPSALKIIVETLGFQHLDLDVTVPRVAIFRDAIVDLFDMELGPRSGQRGGQSGQRGQRGQEEWGFLGTEACGARSPTCGQIALDCPA
ncbi:unnamed protein product [Effrenium voratum]|nr:unnamed protein product [Effrenium voratum]